MQSMRWLEWMAIGMRYVDWHPGYWLLISEHIDPGAMKEIPLPCQGRIPERLVAVAEEVAGFVIDMIDPLHEFVRVHNLWGTEGVFRCLFLFKVPGGEMDRRRDYRERGERMMEALLTALPIHLNRL